MFRRFICRSERTYSAHKSLREPPHMPFHAPICSTDIPALVGPVSVALRKSAGFPRSFFVRKFRQLVDTYTLAVQAPGTRALASLAVQLTHKPGIARTGLRPVKSGYPTPDTPLHKGQRTCYRPMPANSAPSTALVLHRPVSISIISSPASSAQPRAQQVLSFYCARHPCRLCHR